MYKWFLLIYKTSYPVEILRYFETTFPQSVYFLLFRLMYKWFLLIYKTSYAVGILRCFETTFPKSVYFLLFRLMYKWFLLIYKTSYAVGILGYFVIMFTLFGLNVLVLIKPNVAMDFGLLLLFYGLYYGVVGRDFAEVCTDKMAANIGVSIHNVSYLFIHGLSQQGVCSFCEQPHSTKSQISSPPKISEISK